MATIVEKPEHWRFPGKILVVDDKFGPVEGFIDKLLEYGCAVQYWDSKKQPEMPFRNIRVVILDLVLDEVELDPSDEAFYESYYRIFTNQKL
jgi:hypothetical protein